MTIVERLLDAAWPICSTAGRLIARRAGFRYAFGIVRAATSLSIVKNLLIRTFTVTPSENNVKLNTQGVIPYVKMYRANDTAKRKVDVGTSSYSQGRTHTVEYARGLGFPDPFVAHGGPFRGTSSRQGPE